MHTNGKRHPRWLSRLVPRSGPRLSLPAVGVAVVILLGGVSFGVARSNRWAATATVMVLPAFGLDGSSLSSYYETLSRGQVVATYAEMLSLQRFEAAALRQLHVPPATRRKVRVTTRVIPSTAVIEITATAPSRQLAERTAEGVLADSSAYVDRLNQPFILEVVSHPGGTGRRTGPPLIPLVVVVLVVALVTGIVTDQSLAQLRFFGIGGPWRRDDTEEGASRTSEVSGGRGPEDLFVPTAEAPPVETDATTTPELGTRRR